MEIDNIEEKFKKKGKISRFFKIAIPVALISGIFSAGVTFTNYNKLVELNNVRSYKITSGAVENPYNIHIHRETVNDSVRTYLVNTRTADTLEIKKNMNVGDWDYRLRSLIGEKEDKESIVGKYHSSKESIEERIRNIYQDIKNYFRSEEE